MKVWWCKVDSSGFNGLCIADKIYRQGTNAVQDNGQIAGYLPTEMHHDKNSRIEIRGKLPDQLAQSLNTASRAANNNDMLWVQSFYQTVLFPQSRVESYKCRLTTDPYLVWPGFWGFGAWGRSRR